MDISSFFVLIYSSTYRIVGMTYRKILLGAGRAEAVVYRRFFFAPFPCWGRICTEHHIIYVSQVLHFLCLRIFPFKKLRCIRCVCMRYRVRTSNANFLSTSAPRKKLKRCRTLDSRTTSLRDPSASWKAEWLWGGFFLRNYLILLQGNS